MRGAVHRHILFANTTCDDFQTKPKDRKEIPVPEIYYLNKDESAMIPTPHDCIVERISKEDGYIVFTFEKDISRHDFAKHFKSEAKSLTVKIHLCDEDIGIFEWHNPNRLFAKNGYFKLLDRKKLTKLTETKCNLEYLCHYVRYNEMIIELCSDRIIRLEIATDFVEFYWI